MRHFLDVWQTELVVPLKVRRIFVPTINDHLHTNYSGVSPNASFHPELTG